MKTKMLLLGACVALLSSCASYRQTAPIIGYDNNRINVNVSADLDVQNAKRFLPQLKQRIFRNSIG